MTLEPLLRCSPSSFCVNDRFLPAGRVGMDSLGDLEGRPDGLEGSLWLGCRL